jgi:hypothetical protein
MRELVNVIQQIQVIPGAKIDCTFGQGQEAVRQHLIRFGRDDELQLIDELLAQSREELNQINQQIAPNSLPHDYTYFLTHFGGLSIESQAGLEDFIVFGTGPLSREWADGTLLDYNEGLVAGYPLYIAIWLDWDGLAKVQEEQAARSQQEGFKFPEASPFDEDLTPSHKSSLFFLDVAGIVAKNGILLREESVSGYSWVKVADTFTEWLKDTVSIVGK